AIRPFRGGCMRLGAPFAGVCFCDERGHQLAVADRPRGGPAHGLLGDSLHWPAVEIGAVLDELDDIEHRLSRDCVNEREQGLRAQAVAAIQDREAHAQFLLVAASRLASACSYCRVAWPIAAHTTISKIWSSLRPEVRAAAKSSSVTLYACIATFWISVFTGSASPALSNAARRWARDDSPRPSRIRATSALCARLISDIWFPLPLFF